MKIETNVTNEIAVVKLDGRFDAHHAATVKANMMHLIEVKTPKLVVNLAEVNFIDSAGLAVLVQGMKRCREAGGELRLCHLQTSVVVILEMSGLDKALAIHEDVAAAIMAFAAIPA